MSALDRLQGMSIKAPGKSQDGVFDIKTPAGAFLQRVHNAGYKMYEPCYVLKPEHHVDESTLSGAELEQYQAAFEVSEERFAALPETFHDFYEKSTRYTELHNVLTTDGNQIVNAVAGSGKALMNGTEVLTSEGYVPIETLKLGDKVFGEDGKLHVVQGVFPQGWKPVYLVEFSDGHQIPCSGDHLWEIYDEFHPDVPYVISTKAILDAVHLRDRNGNLCCHVPVTKAVEFEYNVTQTVHPYLLGLILAAGEFNDSGVVIDMCNVIVMAQVSRILSASYADWAIDDTMIDGALQICGDKLIRQLAELRIRGLCTEDRFIPKEYLYSSIENRLELLRGLIDGNALLLCNDGVLNHPNWFRQDMVMLCESLGLVVDERISGGELVDRIMLDEFPGLLFDRRKSATEICEEFSTKSRRYITHIENLNWSRKMTCISIDSPRHLYLTEHCIPTHNTTMLVFKILHDIVTGKCMTLKELPNGMQVRVANKVWVCTFLRSGAEELEAALTNWQYKFGYSQTAPSLSFSTMDAEFKRCLNAMGVATPLDEGGKLYSCLVKAIDSCNIKRNGYNLSKEDYNIISGIVTYYRGRLDEQRYKHPSCQEYELTPTILDLLVKQFAALRQQAGIMDFSEIMELLYKYLYVTPNPQVQEFVANRYNFIYIDEFQDTSQMAYAILKFYARGKLWLNRSGEPAPADCPAGMYIGHETLGKLVVVGDTAQCVLSDTKIRVEDVGMVRADEIAVGDRIQAIIGENKLGYVSVNEVLRRQYSGNVCRISLTNGEPLSVTEDHKCFIKLSQPEVSDVELCMFGGEHMQSKLTINWKGEQEVYQSYNLEDLEELIHQTVLRYDAEGLICSIQRTAVLFLGEKYRVVSAKDVSFGDVMCIYDEATGSLKQSAVIGVDIQPYVGDVYDFNIFDVHNFFANNTIVHNCIYSFRGSDSNILATEVADDFHPTISALSVNWRCPDTILAPVVPSIHKNWDSANQDIRAANKGGELFAYTFSNYQQMIAQLKRDIQQDMEDGMKVAILCRTNFDGLIPAVVLEQDGRFNFSVSGENMTMSSPLPRKLIGVTSLFTERATPAVKNALVEFAGRNSTYEVKQLIDVMKSNSKSFWDIPEADIKYSCPALLNFYRDVKPLLTENGVRTKEAELEALRVVYFKLMSEVYGGDSAYCESARAYIETLLFILDSGNFKSVRDFLEEIEFLNDKLNGRIKKRKVYVQIATVHEFKGKEADSVYIWNDNDGVFPYSKCDMSVEAQVNEERRVHYIACTRAKKREHIYAMRGKVGMFAREMDVKFTNPVTVAAKLPKK